jgi:DNA-binding transcriptional LysR family regulator
MTSAEFRLADQLAVQQLRSFCVVYEKQSYSAAAKEVGFSVPTIWEQVRGLEKRYATTLFRRRGRRIQATAAAAVLYAEFRSLLAGLDSTFDLVRESEGDHARVVTLVTGARMMLEDLSLPLKAFRDRYTSVCLRLVHGSSKAAEEMILAGEADLALTLEPGPGVLQKAVCCERAYPIDYLAILPKQHPLSARAGVGLADLVRYPMVIGHAGTYGRQLIEQALHHEGLSQRMQIAAETDTSAFTIACVRAGMGIGIVAGHRQGFLMRDLVVHSLQRQLGQAWIAFLWKRGWNLSPMVRDLVQLVRDAGEGIPATMIKGAPPRRAKRRSAKRAASKSSR